MENQVFIVRDAEERYIKGVFRTRKGAEGWIKAMVPEMTDEPEGSDEWQYMYEQYEILEMEVEGDTSQNYQIVGEDGRVCNVIASTEAMAWSLFCRVQFGPHLTPDRRRYPILTKES